MGILRDAKKALAVAVFIFLLCSGYLALFVLSNALTGPRLYGVKQSPEPAMYRK